MGEPHEWDGAAPGADGGAGVTARTTRGPDEVRYAPPGPVAAGIAAATPARAGRAAIGVRGAGALLALGGAAAVAVAVGRELGGDEARFSFGAAQISLATAGLAALVGGLELATAAGASAALARRPALTRADLARAARLAWIALEAGLLLLVVRLLRIENPVLAERVAVLAFAGFVASAILPRPLRLRFFVALSVLGAYAVFGAASGAWLLGVGLALLGICHLPIAFGARVALLLAAGAGLAAMRAGAVPTPWTPGMWPILASMFMFRLVLYMYDLRHAAAPPGAALGVSYFFLFPNLAFPLFPTVDFATFRRTYFDRDALTIYQEGVSWMLRGIVHLLLYRLVYTYAVIAPEEIGSVAGLSRYVVANFLLYLRVSGSFHLIVGILHLFGFRLPETHRFFYLASSFSDFWRRINIYWKDFMQKVVYLPAFFRLRRAEALAGRETLAIALATAMVFAATWFLHAYQWFWILGSFLLSWTDVAFWSILAVGLIASTMLELRRGRARALGAPAWTLRTLAARALRTTGMFVVISTLWALWTSESFAAFGALFVNAGFARAPREAWTQLALLLVALLAVVFLATALFRGRVDAAGGVGRRAPSPARERARALLVPAAAVLILVAVRSPLVARYPLALQDVATQLRTGELNRRDAALMRKGYYENLTGVTRFSGQLWEVQAERPRGWKAIDGSGAARTTGDFIGHELVPDVAVMYQGVPFRTNRWGMRDRDYALVPPPRTLRIALLGPSFVMGEGVRDEDVLDRLVEERLARELSPRTGLRYEVLNFGISHFWPSQQLRLLETKVLRFRPDVVLFSAEALNDLDLATHLAEAAGAGVRVPYDFMREIARRAGVDSTTPREVAAARLRPFREELLGRTYRRMGEMARAAGARPVWVFFAMPEPAPDSAAMDAVRRLGRASGMPVIDLGGAFAGQDLESLWVASFDRHPNARGHRLLGDALYAALLAQPGLLAENVGFTAAGGR